MKKLKRRKKKVETMLLILLHPIQEKLMQKRYERDRVAEEGKLKSKYNTSRKACTYLGVYQACRRILAEQ